MGAAGGEVQVKGQVPDTSPQLPIPHSWALVGEEKPKAWLASLEKLQAGLTAGWPPLTHPKQVTSVWTQSRVGGKGRFSCTRGWGLT